MADDYMQAATGPLQGGGGPPVQPQGPNQGLLDKLLPIVIPALAGMATTSKWAGPGAAIARGATAGLAGYESEQPKQLTPEDKYHLALAQQYEDRHRQFLDDTRDMAEFDKNLTPEQRAHRRNDPHGFWQEYKAASSRDLNDKVLSDAGFDPTNLSNIEASTLAHYAQKRRIDALTLGPGNSEDAILARAAREPNNPAAQSAAQEVQRMRQLQKKAEAKAAAEGRIEGELGEPSGETGGGPTPISLPPGMPNVGDVPAPTGRAVNEDVLKGQSPAVSNLVRGLVQYKIPLPAGFALKSPYWQRVMGLAGQYDPTFDATQYNVRMGVRKDFTSGPTSKNIVSLNTVIGHLDTLKKASEKLNPTWSTSYNTLKNYVRDQTDQPEVKNFRIARDAVATEMMRVFRGAGVGSEREIEAWKKNLDEASGPTQLKEGIEHAVSLMESRMDALADQYERGMGHPLDFELLSPKTKQTLARIKGEPTATLDTPTTAAPSGVINLDTIE